MEMITGSLAKFVHNYKKNCLYRHLNLYYNLQNHRTNVRSLVMDSVQRKCDVINTTQLENTYRELLQSDMQHYRIPHCVIWLVRLDLSFTCSESFR
jgi:hypothetical protein